MRGFWREETRRIAVLKEQDTRVWAGIIWLRIGAPTNGGSLLALCIDSFGNQAYIRWINYGCHLPHCKHCLRFLQQSWHGGYLCYFRPKLIPFRHVIVRSGQTRGLQYTAGFYVWACIRNWKEKLDGFWADSRAGISPFNLFRTIVLVNLGRFPWRRAFRSRNTSEAINK